MCEVHKDVCCICGEPGYAISSTVKRTLVYVCSWCNCRVPIGIVNVASNLALGCVIPVGDGRNIFFNKENWYAYPAVAARLAALHKTPFIHTPSVQKWGLFHKDEHDCTIGKALDVYSNIPISKPDSDSSVQEQDFVGPHKCTFTLKFEFCDGEVLEIPPPGSGWRPDEEGSYDWPYMYTTCARKENSKCWELGGKSSRGSASLKVWHKEGQMFLHDCAARILKEEARIVSWASWEWVGVARKSDQYKTAYPTLKQYLVDEKGSE